MSTPNGRVPDHPRRATTHDRSHHPESETTAPPKNAKANNTPDEPAPCDPTPRQTPFFKTLVSESKTRHRIALQHLQKTTGLRPAPHPRQKQPQTQLDRLLPIPDQHRPSRPPHTHRQRHDPLVRQPLPQHPSRTPRKSRLITPQDTPPSDHHGPTQPKIPSTSDQNLPTLLNPPAPPPPNYH